MYLDCVQETWNHSENVVIMVIDDIVPPVPYTNENKVIPQNSKKSFKHKKGVIITGNPFGMLSRKQRYLNIHILP